MFYRTEAYLLSGYFLYQVFKITMAELVLPDFYQRYVDNVDSDNLTQAFITNCNETLELIRSIPEPRGSHAYAEGKWTIKEVIAHMIDVERVFAYRAMRFSRNDKTELPGFEENDYTPNSNANNRKLYKLAEEFANLRNSTVDLFGSFNAEMIQRSGSANGLEMTVETLGFLIVGHEIHHRNILLERYLSD